ncbi:MAG: flagellar hook-basal body complex protein FliE [Thermotogota bacterium]
MIDKINGIQNVSGVNKSIPTSKTQENANVDFSNMLKDAINDVNNLQKSADKAAVDYSTGKINDVHQVIIAAEKASLSLQLTSEVTGKIIDSYKEIMRMQL